MITDVTLRNGEYKDVNSVYQGLKDDDKEYVTPGRRVYGDFPRTLAGRTVAYDNGIPVGFADIVGVHNGALHVNTAVSPSHRGHGLSSAMVKDALRKVVSQIHEKRGKTPSGLDINRIYWVLDKNNKASAKAAEKAGFKKEKRWPWYKIQCTN
jgi:RimJ/RimL family protein N-acetyltransferase